SSRSGPCPALSLMSAPVPLICAASVIPSYLTGNIWWGFLHKIQLALDLPVEVTSSMLHELKDWRRALPKGVCTLDGAGAMLGVTGVQMYRYENGHRRIPPEPVQAISLTPGIPPE